MGGSSINEANISTHTDTIIQHRNVEMFGDIKRGLTVHKMRGSIHDKGIREFTIDQKGMHLGRRFRNVTGILAGNPIHLSPADVERAWSEHDSALDARGDGSHSGPERRRP
jgi:circadian clock protein KaiC